MNTQQRSNLAVGLLLLIIGGWFLAVQFYPELEQYIRIDLEWPLFIIGLGLVFWILAALVRAPGLAVPGAILAGIGGLLYYQNQTNDWESWAYAWTLIPGFVGVGVFLMNLFEGRFGQGLREGGGMVVFSLIMFGIFGAFLGGPPILSTYWPALLIIVGLWLVLRGLFRPKISHTIEE